MITRSGAVPSGTMHETVPEADGRLSISHETAGRRSDDRIRDDIVDELNWDGSITNEAQIRVTVRDGIVTLAGQVDSFSQRRAVAQAAQRVRGVRHVVDATSVVLRHPPAMTRARGRPFAPRFER